MNAPAPTRDFHEPAPGIVSFYHLTGCDLTRCACTGTACYVARRSLGQLPANNGPRVFCLGRCFEAPATGHSRNLPHIEVHSSEPVLLSRIMAGVGPSLDAYCLAGGYAALDRARTEPREAVLAAIEDSGLRGRGGAGFPPAASGARQQINRRHRNTSSPTPTKATPEPSATAS